MVVNRVKECTKCKIIKPLGCFEKRPDSIDGYRHYCRECKQLQWGEAKVKRFAKDDMAFWKSRSSSLNNPTGRRTGIAGKVIRSSDSIQAEQLKDLYEIQKCSCHYCHLYLIKEDIVFDHKDPLSRTGQHTIDNIAICCKDCNQLKGTRNEQEFIVFIMGYIKRFA